MRAEVVAPPNPLDLEVLEVAGIDLIQGRVAGAPGVAALVAPLSLRTASILGDGYGWYGEEDARWTCKVVFKVSSR